MKVCTAHFNEKEGRDTVGGEMKGEMRREGEAM